MSNQFWKINFHKFLLDIYPIENASNILKIVYENDTTNKYLCIMSTVYSMSALLNLRIGNKFIRFIQPFPTGYALGDQFYVIYYNANIKS